MSTYCATTSFSLRSSLLALRNTLAMPPSPSAARFFCSSTRDVTFCLMSPSSPCVVPPLMPVSPSTEPLPLLGAPSPELFLVFVGMFLLLQQIGRARDEPITMAGIRDCPPKPWRRREPGAGIRKTGAYLGNVRDLE